MKLKEKLKIGRSCNSKGYFDSYKDNIFGNEMNNEYQEMFDNGSGGELHSKAEAVHSSSMLSYNMLHWIDKDNPFVFNGVKYTKVYFEVQMRTLRGRSNPANMDIVLEGETNDKRYLLFIASKFLEYLENSKFELSESYKKQENWYNSKIDWVKIIKEAEGLCNQNGYNGGIKQAITHLFGIHGLGDQNALEWFNKKGKLKIDDYNNVNIAFANFIFEPDENEFVEEHNAYVKYKKLYGSFVSNLPQTIKTPQWYSYTEVWNILKGQVKNNELISFIEDRYMKFAKK